MLGLVFGDQEVVKVFQKVTHSGRTSDKKGHAKRKDNLINEYKYKFKMILMQLE
jgi:uncharacterized protein YecE (DUF72 family)